MADFYDEMADVATELLTEFNQGLFVLSRPGTPTPGANEWDAPTPGTPQTWTLQGISEAVEAKYVDGMTILASDRQVMVAPFADQPKQGDILSINGVPQTVLAIKPVTERGVAWVIIIKA